MTFNIKNMIYAMILQFDAIDNYDKKCQILTQIINIIDSYNAKNNSMPVSTAMLSRIDSLIDTYIVVDIHA